MQQLTIDHSTSYICGAPCTQIPHCDTKRMTAPVWDTRIIAQIAENRKLDSVPEAGWSMFGDQDIYTSKAKLTTKSPIRFARQSTLELKDSTPGYPA